MSLTKALNLTQILNLFATLIYRGVANLISLFSASLQIGVTEIRTTTSTLRALSANSDAQATFRIKLVTVFTLVSCITFDVLWMLQLSLSS